MRKRIVFYDAYLNESGIKGGSCIALFNLIKGIGERTDYELIILSNTENNPLVEEYKKLGAEVITNKFLKRLLVYDRSSGMVIKLLVYLVSALLANFWLIRYLRRVRPDSMVYNDQRGASTFILTSFFTRSRLQIVSIVRGTKDIRKLYYRVCYALSHTIVAVSKSVQKGLPDRSRFKSLVIYDGIAGQCTKDKSARKEGALHLLTVANIARYKGLDLVIRSIAEYPPNLQKQLSYHVVGAIKDMSYYNELKELYKSLDAGFDLIFEGFQEDVYSFLVRSDVFILPSREEGFGLVLLEAMDCALPLLGSNVGGIPEIIENGYNGYIFTKDDHVDLGKKLRMVIEDHILREQLASNSKSRFAHFKVNETIEEYINIL